MKIELNTRIKNSKISEIRSFNDYAKSVGVDTILTLGEPNFQTPKEIIDTCINSLTNNETKYGPTYGLLSLRKKIAQFETNNGFSCSPEEIIITHGSTEALAVSLYTMINPGDEIIIPMPTFPLYRQLVETAGGVVIPLDTSCDNFQITYEKIKNSISKRTKAIIITSPNNPTGTCLNDESYNNIYNCIKDKPIYVICDEVYNQITYDNIGQGFTRFKDMRDQTIICQSYSKSYAMPGWRCGYMIASKSFIDEAMKFHQFMITALNTFIQPAMIKALDYDNSHMVLEYRKRRDYIYTRLVDMGLEVIKPNGAFYIFPSIKKYGISSLEFCSKFAKEQKVAIIPGSFFEAEGFVRISYCVDFNTIITACDRLEKFIKTLKKN